MTENFKFWMGAILVLIIPVGTLVYAQGRIVQSLDNLVDQVDKLENSVSSVQGSVFVVSGKVGNNKVVLERVEGTVQILDKRSIEQANKISSLEAAIK